MLGYETRHETERFIDTCVAVSQETYSAEDFAGMLTKRLPKLTASLKDAFRFITTWDYARPEVINVSSLRMKLRQVQYTDIDGVVVPKPVGFTGNLHDYLQGVHKQRLDVMVKLNKEVLTKILRNLAYYMENPDGLKEHRDTQKTVSYDQRFLDSLINEERKWLLEGNRSSEAEFGELFGSNTECLNAVALINDINQVRWRQANPKDVSHQVKALQQTAEMLLDTVKQNQEPPSKVVMVKIADELELAARWVEWFSVMQTRIIDTTTAMKQMEKVLLRAL